MMKQSHPLTDSPRLTEISQEQYDSVLYYVGAFEKALHGMEGRLSENPWYGTRAASSGQAYKIEFLSNTENLSHSLRKIAVLADKIDSGLGSGMTESFSQVKSLLGIPEGMRAVCMIAVGHKGMERKPQNEDRLKWERVHIGQY